MNLSEIKYIDVSTSSLSYGSPFSQNDLQFYTDGSSSLNFPFGTDEKDVVKFSVYSNLTNAPIASSVIYATGSRAPHTQSYYDVYNKQNIYSYETFTSDWVLVGSPTKSLLFDVAGALGSLGISDGNYVITLELLRNLVGSESSSGDQLIIDTISTGRDEIALIPQTLAGSPSDIVNEFNIFSNNQIQVKEIAQTLLNSIGSPQIYTAYYSASAANSSGANSLKFSYGFNSGNADSADINIILWLTDVYYGVQQGGTKANGQVSVNTILGIYDQFKNWVYSNYNSGATFQDIKNYYYSLFRVIVDIELSHINNIRPSDYDNIINFLQNIYYNTIFYPPETIIENNYNTNLSGYFKNYINLADGTSYSILNRKLELSTDPRFNNQLVLKLDAPLPASVGEGDFLWITNTFGFLPIVQNIYYYTKPVNQAIPLRGPNFLIKIENEGNSTEQLSIEQVIGQTGSLYNELLSKLGSKSSSSLDFTDYRHFKNFINFSSATMRLTAFTQKLSQIKALQQDVISLDTEIAQNPTDQYYVTDQSDTNSQIDQLKSSFDGYETFLYDNPAWYPVHEISASLYDRNNLGSLINTLPGFILEDHSDNKDYITFVGMIGHFFDNLAPYIAQITQKNKLANSPNSGIASSIVSNMLSSLGWDVEISKDNLPLLLASFSQRDFDPDSPLYSLVNEFSEEERNQIIWKRILNSLPLLYKTKGTEAGLNALISCFGIPKNIIKIKEYGGIKNAYNLQDETLYIIEEVKYQPHFSGSSEYFELDWTGSAQTVELNFSFDSTNTGSYQNVFRLISCDNSWVVGAYREHGQVWGRMFFSLSNGSGSIYTVMTDKAPLFDGNTYHAMLRRNDPAPEFNLVGSTDAQIDIYPIEYDLCVQKANDARVVFSASGSFLFSGSYNQTFRSGSHLYIGNYQQSTASLNLSPIPFFGGIDEIKIWEGPMSDASYINHTLHQGSYELDNPQQMIADNLFRLSFDRPIDLYTGSGVVTLNNLSFRDDFPTFSAVNFPQVLGPIIPATECDPTSGSIFPYQFTSLDTIQTTKIPDYGANQFKSNKINYVEQELVSNLSPFKRVSVQSSVISSIDANKLGVFFSPSDIQNTEIIKFFGDYPLSDLIGDPSDVYASSYKKFEKFKQIFYDQGLGAVDYQFFMNVVRFYFDKAMMAYIKTMVPARAKLVDGILIEPSILERPKIQLKPIEPEVILENIGNASAKNKLVPYLIPSLTQSLVVKRKGYSILNDVNQTKFPVMDDVYGVEVFANGNGTTFYEGDYYRADIIKYKAQYQVYNQYNTPNSSPSSSLSDYQRNIDLCGAVQTISKDYYVTSLALLPVATSYPITMSFLAVTPTFYFSGSLVAAGISGVNATNIAFRLNEAHTLTGIMTGSIVGFVPGTFPGGAAGSIRYSGLNIVAQYSSASSTYAPSTASVILSGSFSVNGGHQMFAGSISFGGTAMGANPISSSYYTTFMTANSTSSIFDEFKYSTSGILFGYLGLGLDYRLQLSMVNYPKEAKLLTGYNGNHYKYTKQQFSQKVENAYDQNGNVYVWKKGSQTTTTTIDPSSGLLNNSSPVETTTT